MTIQAEPDTGGAPKTHIHSAATAHADDPMNRLIDVALEMTERDNAIIDRMEEAYLAGDRDEVFRLAGELIECGTFATDEDDR